MTEMEQQAHTDMATHSGGAHGPAKQGSSFLLLIACVVVFPLILGSIFIGALYHNVHDVMVQPSAEKR